MHVQTWPSPRVQPRVRTWTTYQGERGGLLLSYAAGEAIYVEGDPAYSLYLVISGAVRTVRHSIDGRRQIGGFYYPGDLFGLDAGVDHAFSAEAMRPTEVTVRPHAGAFDASGDHMIAALSELERAQNHLAMLGRRSAGEKVASFLVDMAREGGADVANLPMSRQDMADYLGLAIETVSRVLGQFQAQGLVVFASCRDFHVVRGAALNRLAAS